MALFAKGTPKRSPTFHAKWRSPGDAKLIASHDLDFIYDTCDRVLLLHHGQLAADGPAREILCDKTLLEKCELELPLRWQRDF